LTIPVALLPESEDRARFCWRGHPLELMAGRAVWDPDQGLLLVADLHLGKAETLQALGIPLPSDGDATTLNRLLDLAHRLQPRQVLVLGDLIHGRLGLTPGLRATLAALPSLLGCDLRLIGGNHDRRSWIEGLPQETPRALGPLWLSHEPMAREGYLNICGHLHPVAIVGRGVDRLRLPCFAYNPAEEQLQLPSFGALTGGHPCAADLHRWVVLDDRVVAWPQAPLSSGRPERAPHRRG
jgi:DNA ligase-associated metallophosphoesterase